MVGILAYFFEVIVFAAHAQAFLTVDRAGVSGPAKPEEDVLELVHSGICEKQCPVVIGNYGRAWHELVVFFSEKVDETCSYLL